MIEVKNLTKRFGDKLAVNNISFTLPQGKVTGFLGPNGSGKTTTMRCMLGLATPTKGEVLIDGKHYNQLKNPLSKIGAMIDAKAFHKARSARNHLRQIAATHGISDKRVDEVLEIAGLASVSRKNAGGFSLGMGQRIGIATALLGNPEVLILDEPVNGLDPEGVKWVRDFCRNFAESGKTVLISSHLMSEVEQTADELILIGRGEILRTGSVQEILDSTSSNDVLAATSEPEKLNALLVGSNMQYNVLDNGDFLIRNATVEQVGGLAMQNNVLLTKLAKSEDNLEEAFMKITENAVEYHGGNINV
jgi:ABC-2 type transport system ATP-binding protein